MHRIRQVGKRMQTSLRGIANKASKDSHHCFRNLYGLLNAEALIWCWGDLNKRAAAGVDRVIARDYAKKLDQNLTDLASRLKEKRYKAKLVRRKHIPKENGTRALGIPVLEDRLVQLTAARVLEAIYEPVFLPCSWAYREKRDALEAVSTLTRVLQFGCYGHVVEIDIVGFYDHIDHDLLLEILAQRIDDRPFLRLIKKWLKAGVLEVDGSVRHPETGCPQGGCISPILANIYLHHVLDEWFHEVVAPRCAGRTFMCRYADDIVFAFQYKRDAERFFQVLPKRLGRYGLELSVDKSQILRFSRYQVGREARAFDFLGFEFRWIPDRQGVPRVTRRTSRKRLRRSLRRTKEWIKANRSTRIQAIVTTLKSKLRGYYQYYGVIMNSHSLWAFYRQAMRIVFKWLNRRSHRRSYNWEQFKRLWARLQMPRPRITECRYRQMVLNYAR